MKFRYTIAREMWSEWAKLQQNRCVSNAQTNQLFRNPDWRESRGGVGKTHGHYRSSEVRRCWQEGELKIEGWLISVLKLGSLFLEALSRLHSFRTIRTASSKLIDRLKAQFMYPRLGKPMYYIIWSLSIKEKIFGPHGIRTRASWVTRIACSTTQQEPSTKFDKDSYFIRVKT